MIDARKTSQSAELLACGCSDVNFTSAMSLRVATPLIFVHGYPWVLGQKEIHAGQVMTLTTREDAVADHNLLPIMCVRVCNEAAAAAAAAAEDGDGDNG
eukprot:scaffold153262_cov18-Tisochrysis_lutea.AAC.3